MDSNGFKMTNGFKCLKLSKQELKNKKKKDLFLSTCLVWKIACCWNLIKSCLVRTRCYVVVVFLVLALAFWHWDCCFRMNLCLWITNGIPVGYFFSPLILLLVCCIHLIFWTEHDKKRLVRDFTYNAMTLFYFVSFHTVEVNGN